MATPAAMRMLVAGGEGAALDKRKLSASAHRPPRRFFMSAEYCSPYPHHSWLAHWIAVRPPQVFDVHERCHVAHHLLLTTSGDADIRWMSGGTEMAYHSAIGSLSFFPCDHQPHSLSITAVDGFIAYDLIIPDRQLRTACVAEGVPPMGELRVVPGFRDGLLEASLLRLSTPAAGRQVSEDIGDEIAARQILLRLGTLVGAGPPVWHSDGSVFAPAIMRQLVASIDAHLVVPLSLATLADTVRLSTGHFARKFHHSAGLSVNRFINTRRISASFPLLLQGTSPLAAIAMDVGFSSQSHFTRLFTGLTGITPDQFRRLHPRVVG
jgi:AraC family transcriptional regulator